MRGRLSPLRRATIVGMEAQTSFKVPVELTMRMLEMEKKSWKSMHLPLLLPPTAPSSVALVSRDSTSMTLSITPPLDTGVPMNSYKVERVIPFSKSCSELMWESEGGKCSSSLANTTGHCDENTITLPVLGKYHTQMQHCFVIALGQRFALEELLSGLGSQAGCQLDNKRVWTSTSCQTNICESNCFYTLAGSSSYIDSVPPECTFIQIMNPQNST